MADVEVRVVSSSDPNIYSRSATHRLVVTPDTPSSPPLTTKILQIASGRRKIFEAKNDPEGDKRSERRLASHPPTLDEPESKPTKLEAVKVDDLDAKEPPSVKSGSKPLVVNKAFANYHDSKSGNGMISLDVSPPQARKDSSSPPAVSTSNISPRQEPPVSGKIAEEIPELLNSNRRVHEPKKESSSRRQARAPPINKEDTVKNGTKRDEPKSPNAERRSSREPVVSDSRSDRKSNQQSHGSNRVKSEGRSGKVREVREETPKESRPPSRPTEADSHPVRNIHRTDYSQLSVPENEPVSDHYSSRRREEVENTLKDAKIRLKKDTGDRVPKHGAVKSKSKSQGSDRPRTEEKERDEGRDRVEKKGREEKNKPRRNISPEAKKTTSTRQKSIRPLPADAPRIKVGGQQLKSREMETLDPSGESLSATGSSTHTDQTSGLSAPSSNAHSSGGNSSEITSRRKIRSRQKAIEKGLDEAFEPGEFVPEDDEHLESALKIALEESRKQSVREALEAGEDLNAKILESVTRPNAVEEVIEKLVSQRREKLHENKKSARRPQPSSRPEPAKPVKQAEKPKATPQKSRPVKIDLPLPPEPTDVQPVKRKVKRKVVQPGKPRSEVEANQILAETVASKKITKQTRDRHDDESDEAEEGYDSGVEGGEQEEIVIKGVPIADPGKAARLNIHSLREEGDQVEIIGGTGENTDESGNKKPVKKKGTPRPRAKVTVDQGFPKVAPPQESIFEEDDRAPLPGNPIFVSNDPDNQEDVEPLPAQPTRAQRKAAQHDAEEEVDVKLPRATRKIRKGDKLENPDLLGQQDTIYDPLGVDVAFDDDEDSIGDNEYEESSEDETKLTINEKKDEMLYRFKLVKEAYSGIALPRITKKMKLARMTRLYEHVMSRVKMKIKVRNFKIFLIAGMLLMQFLGKKVGADTSGFTVNQMYAMNRYDPFLRELSESDWTSFGVELPVAVRLPFFMLVNMGIFVVAKWIFKKTGKDYTSQFHKLYAQLTGGDDYSYIKDDTGTAGLDAGGGDEEGGGGGIFGMLKSVMGMFGGAGGGDENRPKRGEAKGPPKYKRNKKAD
jgi:hypothetical protein